MTRSKYPLGVRARQRIADVAYYGGMTLVFVAIMAAIVGLVLALSWLSAWRLHHFGTAGVLVGAAVTAINLGFGLNRRTWWLRLRFGGKDASEYSTRGQEVRAMCDDLSTRLALTPPRLLVATRFAFFFRLNHLGLKEVVNGCATTAGRTATIVLQPAALLLPDDQLRALLAHELGHVKHRHIAKAVWRIAVVLSSVVAFKLTALHAEGQSWMVSWGINIAVMGFFTLIARPQAKASRKAECEADLVAAKLVGPGTISLMARLGLQSKASFAAKTEPRDTHPCLTDRVEALTKVCVKADSQGTAAALAYYYAASGATWQQFEKQLKQLGLTSVKAPCGLKEQLAAAFEFDTMQQRLANLAPMREFGLTKQDVADAVKRHEEGKDEPRPGLAA